MLKLVPRDLREASYALGVPKWRTILKVVLPTAMSGLITSSLLADRPGHRGDRAADPAGRLHRADQLRPVLR